MPELSLPDVRIHYTSVEHTGSADARRPDLVLVHGLAADLGFWYLRLAPAFATRRRVIMFDLRGHGRSSAPPSGYAPDILAGDIRSLLDHLDIGEAHVLGHSYGADIALHFAYQYPERVRSLTLADVRLRSVQPRLDLQSWRAWPRYRSLLAHAGIELGEDKGDFGFEIFERMARLRLERPVRFARLEKYISLPFSGRRGPAAARQWLRLLETTNARKEFHDGERLPLEKLSPLKTATLLIYGEHSQALPSGLALKRTLRHASLEIVPGAGHLFPISHPDKLLKPVQAFADTCDSQALPAAV